MLTMIMKSASVVVLLLALLFPPSTNYLIGLQFVVCLGACVVFSQALQSRKAAWMLAFVAVAVLFNPILPVALSRNYSVVLDCLSLGLFGASLPFLKSPLQLSIPSITDRTPGSESL